jgi:hypothetical protein
MEEMMTALERLDWRDVPADEPHHIGEVLSELLAQYQARFPELRVTVVETSVAAA